MRRIYIILKVLLSGIILGFAYSKLMVPNEIINGGVTSFSMILAKITPLSLGFYNQVLVFSFLLISLFFLGKKNVILFFI